MKVLLQNLMSFEKQNLSLKFSETMPYSDSRVPR